MTKPAILSRIDTLLEDYLATGIRASGDGVTINEVLGYLDRRDEFDRRMWDYEGVVIRLHSAPGFAVRASPGSERSYEDAANG